MTKELVDGALQALLPNKNVGGEWKAMRHGEGPEWMVCGPKYHYRPSRMLITVLELDGFTDEDAEANNKAVAEFIVAAVNDALKAADPQKAVLV